jgi:hypothetical protein
MYTVSEQQIEYILNDIRRNGVEMEDLQLNLLDHICCILEQNLKDGDDFESFYQKTVKQFYKKNLWEIEKETIALLIFKNYYAMKKSMIVSGTISLVTLLAGSLFKIMHWPGANPLLILGIIIMSFVFLPILFFLKNRDSGSKRDKLVTGFGVLMGVLLCMSTLFKVMHWPGASVFWMATSAFSMFIFIPIYFFTGIRKPETKVNTIVTTIILVGATGLLFTLTSLRPSKALEFYTFAANQDLVATRNFATEQNNAHYVELLTDSTPPKKEVEELKQKSSDLFMQIENVKLMLVNSMNKENEKVIDYSKLLEPNSNYYEPTYDLFDNLGKPKSELEDLKKMLNAYTNYIKTTYNKNSFGMINTAGTIDVKGDEHEIPWEVFNFYNVPFSTIIRNLTQMQLDIRIVERNCIR